nr:E-selectin-like [Lytechinus pictus]
MRARNEIHFSLENRTELQDACCPGFIKHGNACLIVNCSIPDVFPSHLSALNNECSSGATVEYNTSCSYDCDNGYNTTGPTSLSCTESGELSGDLPNCTGDVTLTSSELQSVCGEINVTIWYNVSRTIRVTYIEEKDGVTR